MATATKPRAKAAARKTTSDGHAPAQAKIAGDRRVDANGVFQFGYETIVIPLRDPKAAAVIDVVDYDGGWLAGAAARRFVGDPIALEEQVRIGSRQSPTREAAIQAAGMRLEAWWASVQSSVYGGDNYSAGARNAHGCALDVSRWLAEPPRNLAQLNGTVGRREAEKGEESTTETQRAPRGKKDAGLTEGREDREEGEGVDAPIAEPKRKAPSRTSRPSVDSSSAAAADAGERLIVVPIESIVVSPKNPRKVFDPAELAKLAESIRQVGIIQPPRVRPIVINGVEHLEIVAGERRWRAAKLAGRTQIAVVRQPMTDTQALLARGEENLKRADLNAIEEAQWCVEMIRDAEEGGGGHTQASLAKTIGKDPSWVSNRIRLLELPERLQALVISQEMPATHARVCLSFKGHPEVMKGVDKLINRYLKDGDGLGTVDEFEHQIQWRVLTAVASPLPSVVQRWPDGLARPVDVAVRPTDAERQQLRLLEFHGETFALNKKLCAQIIERSASEAIAKALAGAKKGKQPAKGEKPRAPTAAEAKAKLADRGKQLKQHVAAVRADWLRYLLAKELTDGPATEARRYAELELWAWLAVDAASAGGWSALHRRQRILGAMLAHHGHRVCKGGFDGIDTWKSIGGIEGGGNIEEVLDATAAAFLFDVATGVAESIVPDQVVVGLADLLSIDVAAAWRAEKLGPLTERYFGLRTKDELPALGKELGVFLEPSKPKSVMVGLLAGKQHAPLPKELAGKSEKRKMKGAK